MRAGPTAAAAVIAALIAAGAAQAAPPADFALDVPARCVVNTCTVGLSYDASLLTAAVTVEVDWDTRDSAGGFSPDASLACPAPPPEDPYSAPPCTARSPVYRRAGEANVAIRVTDPLDVTQGTAHQLVFVESPEDSRAPSSRKPGPGGSSAGL